MTQFTLVDVVPQTHSDETNQDSEPSIGVNLADPQQILISAFTPTDPAETNGPVFVSQDGGATWTLSFILPDGAPFDQTYKFGGISNELYAGDISGASAVPFSIIVEALRTNDPFVAGTMEVLESADPGDQPFIQATTVRFGADSGKDRIYLGYNDLRESGGTGQTSAIDVCLDALAAAPAFATTHIEKRTTPSTGGGSQDGPQVRTAVHSDGTIYAVFSGWRTFDTATWDFTTDIVVVRDDSWGSGASPFTALVDPNDGIAGFRVQTGVALNFNQQIGQERLGGALSIAVHPASSDIVYICWAGPEAAGYTLHVQRSMDRGVTWSAVLLQISNATNPALAISTAGKIGLLCQQLTGTAPNQRWETHFRDSSNGTVWTDTILADTPADTPASQFSPYLGDYADLVAVGKNFYGAFCANNTPDPANFPTVMPIFLRNTDAVAHQPLGTDNVTVIAASIDPFFLNAVEVASSADFYVRDWTDTPTSGDDGTEPSTHWDFWNRPDVWNQFSSNAAFPPDANDRPVSEPAQAGADNYAFARIRRNALPAAGSGSVAVSAHFLVSEFGVGSNYVDWIFSDPGDPDVTFPTPADVVVNFSDTDLGPLTTPPFTWNLGPTTSDHLCLAVEINAPGDPMSAPGLTGGSPGATGTDPDIINDNNKAQRNLGVNAAVVSVRGSTYYGIVHNAATLTRDIAIGLALPRDVKAPATATIEIVTEKGIALHQPWRDWGEIRLSGMMPGENRWIGVTLPVHAGGGAAGVNITELKGGLAVNGFSIVAQPAPAETVIGETLTFHRKVLVRLDKGFGVPAAVLALQALDAFTGGHDDEAEEEREDGRFDFEERVRVEEKDLRIEVHVRVRQGRRTIETEVARPAPTASPTPARYERFIRRQARLLHNCLTQLAATDPFALGTAIAEITAAPAHDAVAVVTAHGTVLHKFDAFMTMLQKAQGDRSDIAQMVRWHRDLCERSPRIAGLPDTAAVKQRLDAFLARLAARTLRLGDYRALLVGLVPALRRSAGGLGAAAELGPLITSLEAAATARAQQKAHRDFLLALQRAA